jgi:Linear amide C-N hydrolases, choloylglycine hydrolase family
VDVLACFRFKIDTALAFAISVGGARIECFVSIDLDGHSEMTKSKRRLTHTALALAALCWTTHELRACTGITLRAKDGTVVFGRTLEWGSFDLQSRLVIVPRGFKFSGSTPDGKPGMTRRGHLDDRLRHQEFDHVLSYATQPASPQD